MPRLTHDDPDMVYACPECDQAELVHRDPTHPRAKGDQPLYCRGCGADIETPKERPVKSPSTGKGPKSKLEHLLDTKPELREEHGTGFQQASDLRTDGGAMSWVSEKEFYKVDRPTDAVWTDSYELAYQGATGERIDADGKHPGEDRITAFGVDPRTTECVYCGAEISYSFVLEHHDKEHPGKRFAHFYYPEVYDMEVTE